MEREILASIGDNKYKVDLGSITKNSFESIFESDNTIEEFDIWLEIENEDDLQKLKRLFSEKGANVKKLIWSNWSKYELSAADVAAMISNLPQLKVVQFSSWNTELTGETTVGSLELPNLCCLEINECGNFIFDFLSAALPDNKLKCLKIKGVNEVDAKLSEFVKKNLNLKKLDICGGDYSTLDSLKELKLERLRCILYENKDDTDSQRAFLKGLIASQTELKSLDLLNDMDYSFSFVDDSIFAEICALSQLETLLINVDDISVEGIKSISNLKSLKTVEFKTNRDRSLPVFQEFSSIKNTSLENLVLRLWSFDIPAETYTALGANYENLKSLRITLGTRHKISFFVGALPNLESLSIKFGEANNPVEFSNVFDGDEDVKNTNLKKLRLDFWGSEKIDSEKFFKLLDVFENLEYLEIKSKFPFTADFVNQLTEKLNTIKVLKLVSFAISNNETFGAEIVDAFKQLRTKLRYANLTFLNLQQHDFGQELNEGEQGVSHSFTYEPFVEALKGVYTANECGFANIRIHNNLVLTAGDEE
ncbi:uncharacterized protein [Chironomus tepperi]|uniref:uncharacterized protein n=1 Tax=Chironomus tepperi TaxID=113505 RepID=UPI00391FB37C